MASEREWNTNAKAAPTQVLLLLTSPSNRLVLATRSESVRGMPEWTAQGGKFLVWEPIAWKLAPEPYRRPS